ncbi:MAG: anthranilate phosphoribosyltransferase [Candidatus Marinimicrobia bacterium]|nr:anthranilate phosphoribosyltransferase [Candidatus Neomarinimicrobiota bacterium]
MKELLDRVIRRQDLSMEEARDLMFRIMSGEFSDIQIAGFLVALRSKRETPSEIAGFVQAMREKMVKVPIQVDAIDMCGTGGDALGTFNVSTAASFVVAGAGVPVAKHGNRSITSNCGSADVLDELGVDIALPPEKVARAIEEIGIGFMFAPSLHPAMKHVMPARKSLGVRTVFNILGPLCNPAGVRRQVIGIFHGRLTDTVAKVLAKLGSEHAYIVHGEDGLDELTTTTSSKVSHLLPTSIIKSSVINPRELGFEHSTLDDLQGGTPKDNARLIRDILAGQPGPKRDIVVLNAAAGLLVGDKAATLKDGVQLAAGSLDSGKALETLDKLVAFK